MPLVSKKIHHVPTILQTPSVSTSSNMEETEPKLVKQELPKKVASTSTQKKENKQKTKELQKKLALQKAQSLKQQDEILKHLEAMMTSASATSNNKTNFSFSSSEDESTDDEDPMSQQNKKKKENKQFKKMMINQQKNLDLLTDLYARQWYDFENMINEEEDEGLRRSRLVSAKGEQLRQRRFVDVIRNNSLLPKRLRREEKYKYATSLPYSKTRRRFYEDDEDEDLDHDDFLNDSPKTNDITLNKLLAKYN